MGSNERAVEREKRTRLERAVAIVVIMTVALAAAIWMSGGSAAASSSGERGEPYVPSLSYEQVLSQVVQGDIGAADVLERAGFVSIAKAEVPVWFAEELLPAEMLEQGAATQDWSVVRFEDARAPAAALDGIAAVLTEKGWSGYESSAAGAATFVKEGGTCQWAMVSCMEVGGVTSVVITLQRTERSASS